MLVEQFVSGDEYSVEMLYSEGKRAFANVTAKVLYPGPRPVEQGHLVPAPISHDLTELLVSETERLLAAVDFGVGLVHCEWIVDDGTPYLIECAGRIPQTPTVSARGAATRHGTSTPGDVISIDGVEEARALAGVKTCNVTVEVGETVRPLRSSWDRTVAVTPSRTPRRRRGTPPDGRSTSSGSRPRRNDRTRLSASCRLASVTGRPCRRRSRRFGRRMRAPRCAGSCS